MPRPLNLYLAVAEVVYGVPRCRKRNSNPEGARLRSAFGQLPNIYRWISSRLRSPCYVVICKHSGTCRGCHCFPGRDWDAQIHAFPTIWQLRAVAWQFLNWELFALVYRSDDRWFKFRRNITNWQWTANNVTDCNVFCVLFYHTCWYRIKLTWFGLNGLDQI